MKPTNGYISKDIAIMLIEKGCKFKRVKQGSFFFSTIIENGKTYKVSERHFKDIQPYLKANLD